MGLGRSPRSRSGGGSDGTGPLQALPPGAPRSPSPAHVPQVLQRLQHVVLQELQLHPAACHGGRTCATAALSTTSTALPPPAIPPFSSPSRPRGEAQLQLPPPPPAEPRPHAPRSQLRPECRLGSSGRGAPPQGPGPAPGPAAPGPPAPRLTRAAFVRGRLRRPAERSGSAKPGRGGEPGQRVVLVGEEPGTSRGSHFSVQAPARADPEEALPPPRRAARAGMCCGERRRGDGRGSGEDGAAEGSNRAGKRERIPTLWGPAARPGPQIPACLALGAE